MNKLFIVTKDGKLNGGAKTPQLLIPFSKGSIGLYELKDDTKWLDKKAEDLFAIVGGVSDTLAPIVFTEVNPKTMSVTFAKYSEAKNGTVEFTVPTPEIGKEYGVYLIKLDAVTNERYRWSVSEVARKDDNVEANRIANAIVKQLNKIFELQRIDAEAKIEGAKVTITLKDALDHYGVAPLGYLTADDITKNEDYTPAIGDKAYVENLKKYTAAEEGYEYLGDDGAELYPGYNEPVEEGKYDLFTIRFDATRSASNTFGTHLPTQNVILAVNEEFAGLATLKTILDVKEDGATSSAKAATMSEDDGEGKDTDLQP